MLSITTVPLEWQTQWFVAALLIMIKLTHYEDTQLYSTFEIKYPG